MKKTILTLSIFTLLLSNSPVNAQKQTEGRSKKAFNKADKKEMRADKGQKDSAEFKALKEERFNKLFERLDADKDGKISKEELANLDKVREELMKETMEARQLEMKKKHQEKFTELDTNKDGVIDKDEWAAFKPEFKGFGPKKGENFERKINKKDSTKGKKGASKGLRGK